MRPEINIKLNSEGNQVEKLAILLAMTETKDEEKNYIEIFKSLGYSSAVTGVAGMEDDIKKKLVSSVIGAGLNEKVINKSFSEMHGLVHATAEASIAIRVDGPVSQSFQLKVAMVRKDNWLCVAMFGNMAIHKVTNHKTIGIGVMHL